ncbi:hypothetical protein HMPREF9440_00242 [Sutterella parvirubra YIT 11816]|uniref:Uncharacterized protein n=1 Tax=Sutterella parvirubra YIT 11816 TaxID=762967 RepID=H3KBZ3_9BURK|nr:hypothetical protein HMPREF9440_00242 [Sutterella parvirubra YIT 11816]
MPKRTPAVKGGAQIFDARTPPAISPFLASRHPSWERLLRATRPHRIRLPLQCQGDPINVAFRQS